MIICAGRRLLAAPGSAKVVTATSPKVKKGNEQDDEITFTMIYSTSRLHTPLNKGGVPIYKAKTHIFYFTFYAPT